MPEYLEKELKKEYGSNKNAIYGTMNKIGAMKGNKETKKGEAMEKKHEMAKKMKNNKEFTDKKENQIKHYHKPKGDEYDDKKSVQTKKFK